ncbi:adenylate kinase [uncultured Pseudokineococcus sp.]|uniref:adenylate kinase n=1 Tax=uncultured Pseudokineococcus sp. TaxID=1642928 RepID=UPI00341AD824
MERVLVLGRGGAGKSTLARALGETTGLPVVELDQHFWVDGARPLNAAEWTSVQERLAGRERWVMDGDLGPHDAPAPRLRRADTVVVLDLPLALCAWRALRRSRERADFWWWVITWRRRSRPRVMDAIATHAPRAQLHVLRSPAQVDRFLAAASTDAR